MNTQGLTRQEEKGLAMISEAVQKLGYNTFRRIAHGQIEVSLATRPQKESRHEYLDQMLARLEVEA